MTTKKKTSTFSANERAAMKERARAVKGGHGEAYLQAKIAAMVPADRTLAKQIHAIVTAAAPALTPKTWYGMPACANADGKIVCALVKKAAWPDGVTAPRDRE